MRNAEFRVNGDGNGWADPEGRFLGHLDVRYIDGVTWMMLANFSYRSVQLCGPGGGRISTVRAGFLHDFASVPWLGRRVLPRSGSSRQPYGVAAVFHDWLYTHHAVAGRPITRRQADDLFLEIMTYLGIARWRREVMYWMVRWFGWTRWIETNKSTRGKEHL